MMPKQLKKTAPKTVVAKKKTAKPTTDYTALEEQALDLQDKRERAKVLQEDVSAGQAQLLDELEELGIASHTFTHDGRKIKVTRQQSTSIVIDEPRLKKRLGATLWNKVSVRVLDKRKLEAFLASGEVSAKIVAECSEDKTTKPFVKVT